MFSSQSGISSNRRNPRSSTISSNYWYTEDNFPYVNLYPRGSTINATDIDTTNNYLYVGGSFSRLYQNNANYHSIYDISSSTFKIKSKNYGTNGRIYAYALDTTYNILYVGGDFTTVTDNNDITIDASYVAAWSISKQRWRQFGKNRQNGLNAVCNALAVDVDNQVLYVGGNFTKMSDALQSDQSANYVAKWMISSQTWAKLGASDVYYNNGLNSICRTLVYDSYNNQLYVGGDFTTVRDGRGLDISANRVAIWKPSVSKWYGFGPIGNNGTNGQILAYVYDSCKNVMYAGGTFTTVFDTSNIGGLSANRIAKWNFATSTWSRLTDSSWNGVDGSCNAFAVDTSNQILYVGGNFTTVYDSSNTNTLTNTLKVATWSILTERWSRLGSTTATTNGLTSNSAYCSALAYDSANSRLYVGGNFTTVGDASASSISANNVVYWNISTSRWAQLGDTTSATNGLNLECRTLLYDASNTQLYVGGDFTVVRDSRSVDISANKIAIWKPSQSKWYGFGTLGQNGTNGQILTYAYDSCKNVMYAGGTFTIVFDSSNITGLSANRIAKWDFATSIWTRLGTSSSNGVDSSCNALAMDTSNQILYVGGNFANAYDYTGTVATTQKVAAWTVATQAWSRLGSATASATTNGLTSTSAYCSALAYDSVNTLLYVGGSFTKVGDASYADFSANNVAYWNIGTSRWSKLGASDVSYNNGLNLECRTLIYDTSNAQLYVGGDFTVVRDSRSIDITANRIAIWKPSQTKWYGFGNLGNNGTNGQILTYAYDSCKNVMYAGGTFTQVYDSSNITGLSANRIAKWDLATSLWSRLGTSSSNGVDGSCNTLAMDTSNQILYVGGNFTNVYDYTGTVATTQKVAAWSVAAQAWSRLGSATATTNGLTSTSAYCNALLYDSSNSRLYVGGSFTKVGDAGQADQSANNVAYWNISTSQWANLGTTDVSYNNGTNAYVNALAYDGSYNRLYVGGNFTTARDVSSVDITMNYVGYWNISTSKWGQLGGTTSTTNGLNAQCRTLAYDGSNAELYVGGDFVTAYNSSGSKTVRYSVKWGVSSSSWYAMGGSSSRTYTSNGSLQGMSSGPIYAVAYYNSIIYFGGDFTSVSSTNSGTVSANRVAAYNILSGTWSALGTGVDSTVNAIAVDNSNNKLYVGGNLTIAGGNSANYIAVWNISTSTWSALGSGLGGAGYSLALDMSKNKLYVCGGFTNAGGTSANYIAVWDISNSTWSALGSGLNGFTYALALDSSNNKLYVGGNFTVAGGTSASSIALWNISNSTWSALSSGVGNNNTVRALALDSSNQKLYLGGDFTSAGGITTTKYVAVWNISNSSWSPLGTGINGGTAYSLALDMSNQKLYVGGTYTYPGNYLTVWNISNSTWSSVGSGTSASVFSLAVNTTDNELYLGGAFTSYAAIYSITNSTYYSVGNYSIGPNNGTTSQVYSFSLDTSNNRLYTGGNFTATNDATTTSQTGNYIVYWNIATSTWSQMGGTTSATNGTNALVSALALDQSKNVFVGGNFTKSSTTTRDTSANYGIIWKPSTSSWSNLGIESYRNGLTDGSCNALAIDSSNQRLYVGGSFTTVNDSSNVSLSANRIAYWDLNTNRWYGLGTTDASKNGLDGSVNALAFDSANNRLYAGGNFKKMRDASTTDLSANYIAYWNVATSRWIQMGGTTSTTNGTNALVSALSLDFSKNAFIGGNFTKASTTTRDTSANYGIIWTPSTSSWTNLGVELYRNGITDGSCNALALDSSNQRLYVGGSFTTVKDSSNVSLSANRVAYWDLNTSAWYGLGTTDASKNGVDGSVNALAFDSANNRLYAVGGFKKVSDASTIDLSANYVAYWNVATSRWTQMGGTTSTTNGTNALVSALALDFSKNAFIGGNFTKASITSTDISANYGIIWTTSRSSWSNLGATYYRNGLTDGSCNALALDSSNQRVYVGGTFTTVKDFSNVSLSANRIAYWNLNTSAWYGLGTTDPSKNGLDGSVNALAFDSANNRLYVGGNFKKMSDSSKADQSANYVAFWDASNSLWGQLGGTDFSKNGVDASVNALAFDSTNNILYVGGNFLNVYDTSFTLASPLKSQYLVTWNPSTQRWTQIGYSSSSTASLYGLSNVCRALIYNSYNKFIYVGGDHTTVCDSSNISADASNIAYINLNTGSIYPLGTSTYNGTNSIINNIKVDTTNNVVYVDGSFTAVYDSSNGALSVNYIAKYDVSTKTWSRLGSSTSNGLGGMGKAMFYDNTNNAVYVSGPFTAVRDSTTDTSKNFNYVAKWDVAKSAWSPLGSYGNGTNGYILAYAYDAANYRVFCGGSFTQVYDNSNTTLYANNVAVFYTNTSTWSVLGASDVSYNNGINSICRTLTYDASNAQLYVGGDFTSVRDGRGVDISANKIAIWKPSQSKWYGFGTLGQNGTNGQILTYAYDSCKNVMYVGGTFTQVYDSSNILLYANRIAKWDLATSLWSRLGTSSSNGVDGSCNALAMDTSNQILYVGGNFTNVYDSTGTVATTQKVAAWSVATQTWSRLGSATATTNGLTSSSAYCNALLYDSSNSRLYVGGSFTKVGDAGQADQSANNVAYWNISTSRWGKLGTTDVSYNNGTNAYVNALAYDGSYNRLYVGGNFTKARDVSSVDISMNYVGYWNISASKWSQLGGTTSTTNGVNAQCRTLVYDSSNAELYVGGDFTTAYNSSGSSSVGYSVKWGVSSSSWYAMGGSSRTYTSNGSSQGISSGSIYAVAYYNSIIYFGGDFTSVSSTNSGSVSANRVAAYNISSGTWSALGTGLSVAGSSARALALDSSNNKLYVGGVFTSAGGNSANYIAVWDITNSTWSALGSGVSGVAYSLTLDSSNNKLYVGGAFTIAGGSSANYVAVWNISNSTWSALGSGTDGYPASLALDSSNNKLYVGGAFTIAGGVTSRNYVAVWDITNSTWSALGSGVSGVAYSLTLDSSNNKLYVGGSFTSAGGSTSIKYIAVWDIKNSTWSALGTGLGTISPLVYASLISNNKLYVGGAFTTAGGNSVNYVAVWDITNSTWSALGSGVSNTVQALALDSTNNELYLCGNFTTAGGVTATGAAIYSITNSTYYPVGNYIIGPNNGTNGQVYSFSLDTSNNRLYTGGNFTTTSDATTSAQTANYIAYWNIATSRWSQMGGSTSTTNGTNALVSAIALDQSKNAFLGGNFTKSSTTVKDTSANYGIIWTPSTSSWSNLGATYYRNGLTDGSCNALALDSSNQRLYVGGSFTTVKDSSNTSLSANRIAYWNLNTSAWYGLGTTDASKNGTNGDVNALTLDSSYTRVYAGGNFTKVSDSAKIDQSANYVAYWDTTSSIWGKLGATDDSSNNGVKALVRTLAYDNANAQVYVGGDFIEGRDGRSCDISMNRVAIWKPSTKLWSGMGSVASNGTNGLIYAQKFDSSNNVLYVGGSFTEVYDTSNIRLTANYIAKWNIATKTWSRLGDSSWNGTNAYVNCIVLNSTKLYVGGYFSIVYDKTNNTLSNVMYMATWDLTTNTWSRMGGGTTTTTNGLNGYPYSMAIDTSNQVLYVSWKSNGSALALYDASNTGTAMTANSLAAFNLSSQRWSRLGSSTSNGIQNITNCGLSLTFDNSNSNLYAVMGQSSSFYYVRDDRGIDISINSIARWNVPTQKWFGLGGHSSNGTNGQINAYAYDNSRNRMYVGGTFNKVYDLSQIWLDVSNVAAWDVAGKYWVRLGSSSSRNGVDGSVNALAFDTSYSYLYVGGNFTKMSDASKADQPANYVAYWDVSNSLWGQLGGTTTATNGLNAQCKKLIYDGSKSQLYVGGEFTQTYDSRGTSYINRIAIWKPSQSNWYGFGTLGQNGTNGQILAYVYDSCKNVMYAGGTFTQVYDSSNTTGLSANRVAKWNFATSTWTRLTDSSWNGVDGLCNAFAMDTSNQVLYVGGNFTSVYDNVNTNTLTNTMKVAKWDVTSSTWSRLGSTTATTNGLTSTSAYCNALAYDSSNSRLYVGGNFTTVGDAGASGILANYVVYWNISTSRWAQLGGTLSTNNGVNAICQALAYVSSNNWLYVGGKFTTASDANTSGRSANYVAYWNASSSIWAQLGGTTSATNGLNLECCSLVYDASNTQLYVGGNFTVVRDGRSVDISANRVAIWKPSVSKWYGFGNLGNNGFNTASPYCSAYDSCKNVVYFSGSFTQVYDSSNISGLSVNYIAKWDIATSTWSRLGSDLYNGINSRGDAMAMDTSNQILYVAGQFTAVNDPSNTTLTVNRIAAWNANISRWSALGTAGTTNNGLTSTNAYCSTLVYDSSNTRLYVGGLFSTVADAGGTGINATNLVYWDISTSRWIRFGAGTTTTNQGVDAMVYDLTLDASNNKLYVAGDFATAYNSTGNTSATKIAIWGVLTSTWSVLGSAAQNGVNGTATTMQYDVSNQILYVGGNFLSVNDSTQSGISAKYIAYWDISGSKWYPLGNSSGNGFNALVVKSGLDTSNNYLYVCGNFIRASSSTQTDISVNYVARWNILSNTWTQLGGTTSTTNGFNNGIRNIVLDSNKNVYIGGDFTKASTTNGDISANYGIIWKPSTNSWSNFGGTYYLNGITDGSCIAMSLDSTKQRLYVGGSFTSVKDTIDISFSANRIAYWDLNTSDWTQLGGTTSTTNGTNALVSALALDFSKNAFIGGNLTSVSATSGNTSANYGIIWTSSTSSWTRLGNASQNGLDGSCNALALDSSNSRLYVGGNFKKVSDASQADQSANYIAYWDISNSLWKQLGTTDVSRNGLNDVCNVLLHDSSNSRLYVGGNFKKVSDASQIDQSANYIAYWDIPNSLWKQLGTTDLSKNGLDGSCNALIYDNSNNRLYVGGAFKKVSDSAQQDQSANYVAFWDVANSIWKQLGGTTSTRNGTSDVVNALALDASKNVFVGGKFVSVNDSAYQTYLANYAAYWSPSTSRWSRLGSIVSNGLSINSQANQVIWNIDIDTSNSILYGAWSSTTGAGYGYYDASNTSGLTSKSLCGWDIKNECWFYITDSSSSVTASYANGVKVDPIKKRVYYLFSGVTMIPDPSNGSLNINALMYYDMITKRVYPLGGSQNSNSTLTNGLLYYNGSTFANISYYNDPWYGISYLETDNSANLYATHGNTGYTPTTYNVACDNNQIQLFRSIVMWDASNSQWSVLGSNVRNGLDASCISMVYDNSNQELYVGGNFANTTDLQNDYLPRNIKTPISKVAKWSIGKSRWSSLAGQRFDASNGTNGAIYASVYDSCKNIIYMGGNFTIVSDTSNGDLSANYIAAWDVSNQYWSRIGTAGNNGLSSICNALAIDSSNQILYVGGQFQTVFDGTYLDQSVNYVAAWNITSQKWSILGGSEAVNGLDGSCNAMAFDSLNNRLYVGGNFRNMRDATQDQSANYVAYWNVSSQRWSRLGASDISYNNGLNAACRTLTYDASNTQLYVGGDFTTVRDGRGLDISANRVAIWKPSVSKWYGFGPIGNNGTNGQILAYVYDSCKNVMYAGGTFTTVFDTSNIGGLSANRIAKWNLSTSTWTRLTDSSWNGVDGSCNAFAVDTSNQILYVGGNFTTVYDSSNTNTLTNTQKVAKWSILTERWSRLGESTATTNGLTSTSTSTYCSALAYDSANSRLYVGGNFTKVGDASYADFSANNVAYWNISTSRWSKLGASDVSYNNGLNLECRTLIYDASNTQLYVGGDFTTVRDGRGLDLSANKIAIWKPSLSKWYGFGNLGQNGTNGQILAYVYDSCKNVMYAGGTFTQVYDSSNIMLSANRIAKWNIAISCWSRLTDSSWNGVDGSCNAFAMDTSNQVLYVGGNFTTVYDSSNTNTLTNTQKVAKWSILTEIWSRLGESTATTNGLTSTSTSTYCSALAYDSANSRLYVGGNFTKVGDASYADFSANNVAYWNISNSRWSKLGASDVSYNNGLNLECRTLIYDASNTQLYVGGDFTTVRDGRGLDLSANKIAIWKPSLSKWYGFGTLGYGNNGQILAYVYDSCKNMIYAAGTFTILYNSTDIISANRVAKWNLATSSWSQLGTTSSNGLDGTCNAVAMDTSNQILYVGGNFSNVYDSTGTVANTQKVAKFDITNSTWSRLGESTATTNGLTSTSAYCNALVYDSANSRLYVGGSFTKVGDASYADFSANNVAYWNISNSRWTRLGTTDVSYNNGTNGYVNTLAYDSSYNRLYVGGYFTKVRDVSNIDISMNYVGYWNISTSKWGQLGGTTPTTNGVNAQCRTLVYDSSNAELYIGGDFTTAYNSSGSSWVGYFTKWSVSSSSWYSSSTTRTYTSNGSSQGVTVANGGVYALNYYDSNIYVGGYFSTVASTNSGTVSITNLAIYNIYSGRWSTFGEPSSEIREIKISDTSQKLYVVGNFTTIGGISASRIACYDITTSTWSALGSGLGQYPYRIVVNNTNTKLYVSGSFTSAGGNTVNSIAVWDISTSTWSALGTGLNMTLQDGIGSMALDNVNNKLYVGGNFTTAGGSSANRIAVWDISTSTWSALGTGLNAIVYDLALDSTNNKLYVCGAFTTAGGNTANYIAVWNISTSTWSALDSSVTNAFATTASVYKMQLDSVNKKLYVIIIPSAGGNYFTAVYNISTYGWSQLQATSGTSIKMEGLYFNSKYNELYVGGNFTGSNIGIAANRCAIYSVTNSTFYSMGSYTITGGSKNLLNSSCYSLSLDTSNNRIYAGGYFTKVNDASTSDISANYIAYWNIATSRWSQMGGTTYTTNGTNALVTALALDQSKNVFVGGNFTKASTTSTDISANYWVVWKPSTSSWTNLGATYNYRNGLTDGSCNAFALDSSNQRIYVGGSFTTVKDSSNSSLSANQIAYWDLNTSAWYGVGTSDASKNGTGGQVYSLALDTSNNRLYAGGNFTKVSDASTTDLSANYLAYWNLSTSRWTQMGGTTATTNGTNALVSALALDQSKNVFLGGNFTKVSTTAKDTSANYGIIWTPSTTNWTNLGDKYNSNGLTDGSCIAMTLDSSNQRIYVGGSFTTVNDSSNRAFSTNRIAYWNLNTSVWSGLGTTSSNGTNAQVYSLAIDTSNNRLYAGGNFTTTSDATTSGLSANYISYWDVSNTKWIQMGGTTSTTNGTNALVSALSLDFSKNAFIGGNFTKASTTAGDLSANYGIIWTPSTSNWSNLGAGLYRNGLTDGSCIALALDSTNQRLYVGGSFTTVKDVSNISLSANRIAYWDLNTSRWLGLGTTTSATNGLSAICRTLNYNANNTTLYAGGDFTRASDSTGYDLSANYIVAWNPTTQVWQPLGSAYRNANNGLNNSAYTISTATNNQVFVGGTFTGGYDISGSITSNYGLIWNPSYYEWSKFGGYSSIFNDGSINALAIDSSSTKLFIGGNFSRMSDHSGNGYNINDGAIWNITTESLSAMGGFNLNGLNFYPNIFAMDTNNNVLYMGGNFTTAYNASNSSSSIFAMYVIGYDITNNKWIQLGNEAFNGVNGEVTGLTIDTTNSILYVSGNYTRMFDSSNGYQAANYIAAYNISTKTWGRLGSSTYNGINIAPNSIAFNSSNKRLYVGGNFTSVYDSSNTTLTVKYIAQWNTTNSIWSRLGANTSYNGVDASINILQYNSSSNYLLTVGYFSNVNDSVNTKIREIANYVTYKF